MRRDPVLALLILCVLLMAYVTAYPFRFVFDGAAFLFLDFPQGRAMWLDAWLNLLFFVPFGLLCGLRFPGWRGVTACALAACLFSSCIEWLQMYIPGRLSSANDIVMNSLGAIVGAVTANRKRLRAASFKGWLRNEIPGNSVGILVCLWVVSQWSPFIPLLKINPIISQLKLDFRWEMSLAQLLPILFGGCAVVFLLAENLKPVSAKRAGWILIGLLPIQLILWDRPKPFSAVLVCAVAIVFAIWWLDRTHSNQGQWLTIAALAIIVMRELSPFRWAPELIAEFLWVPLRGTLDSPRIHAVPVLAEKCFFYWYFLHQANRSFGISLAKLALALSAFVGLAELGQRYQLGRVPEITDPLLCLLGALILYWSAKADQGLNRALR